MPNRVPGTVSFQQISKSVQQMRNTVATLWPIEHPFLCSQNAQELVKKANIPKECGFFYPPPPPCKALSSAAGESVAHVRVDRFWG